MGSGIRRLSRYSAAIGVVGALGMVAACGDRSEESSGAAGSAGAAGSSAAGYGGLAGGATIVIPVAGSAGVAGETSACGGAEGAWPDPEQVPDPVEVAGTATFSLLRRTAKCEGGAFSITAEYAGSTETFSVPVSASHYDPGLASREGSLGINAVTPDSKRTVWLAFGSFRAELEVGDVCGPGVVWRMHQAIEGLSLDDLAEGDWLEFDVTVSSADVDLRRVHGTVCVNYVEPLPL